MNNVDAPDIPEGFINIGTGEDFTIKRIDDFKGKVNWDISKPNGTPRKILDGKRKHPWKTASAKSTNGSSILTAIPRKYKLMVSMFTYGYTIW